MRFITILLTLSLAGHMALAQAEKDNYKQESATFEKHFNEGEYKAIFEMFNSQMKTAVPLNQATTFLTNLKAQAGKIVKREFIEYENGVVALYKAEFERGTLAMKLSLDGNSKINGFLFQEYVDPKADTFPTPERNSVDMRLPFDDEWTVFWGGDTAEQNYHVQNRAQKNAFDIIITDENGKSHKTNGKTNEDYYAFGKELLAPADGEVTEVIVGVKDNVPGEMNPGQVTGNTVVLKTAENEYLLFAHFKEGSIVVKRGQKVKRGELLGLCGNSGNSSEPHIHFHIQNVEDMSLATGVKSYFDVLLVNGELKKDYSPVKGDKIKPAGK